MPVSKHSIEAAKVAQPDYARYDLSPEGICNTDLDNLPALLDDGGMSLTDAHESPPNSASG